MKLLPPVALLAHLERGLPLPVGAPITAPDRHRTIKAVVAWSYDLLDEAERALFRRLAVFVGGFTFDAAAIVELQDASGRPRRPATADAPSSSPGPPPSVVDGVASLVDKNLLRPAPWADDEPRFAMLQTVRDYAAEQLDASGEGGVLRERFAAWCLALAERTDPELWGAAPQRGLRRLEVEYDNLRAALGWLVEQGTPETGLRLATALVRFWYLRPGSIDEGQAWLERALTHAGDAAPGERARATVAAGALAKDRGSYDRAAALLDEGLTLARANEDWRGVMRALVNLGIVARFRGDYPRAADLLGECVELSRRGGDPRFGAYALDNLGLVAMRQGDTAAAVARHGEALALAREAGDGWSIAVVLYRLGIARLHHGEPASAAALLRESVALWRDHGDLWVLAEAIEGLAGVAATRRCWERATRLAAAAAKLRTQTQVSVHPDDWRATHERTLDAVRAALGEPAFARAWHDGSVLTAEQVVAEVLALDAGSAPAPRPAPAADSDLTPRELELLRLVAAGRSNGEIAAALVISLPTTKAHLTHIFGKLGVASRAAATAYAHRHGLT